MKLMLVDDHDLIRAGLRPLLEKLDDEVLILEAEDLPRAQELAAAHPDLDLVLLDLTLPSLTGVPVLRRFRTAHPALPVVVLSASDDRATVESCIAGGAADFLPKRHAVDVLLPALHLVLAGGIYLPPQILPARHAARRGPMEDAAHALTDRQLEVLTLLTRGHCNRDISRRLGVSEGTVKLHVTAVLKALDVPSRTQAAVRALELGLDKPAPACVDRPTRHQGNTRL